MPSRLLLTKTTSLLSLGLVLVLMGCASDVKRVAISDSADPVQEISKLESDVQAASADQLNVESPKNFKAAEDSLSKAKREREANDSAKTVLNTVSEGKGYLEKAQSDSTIAKSTLPDVLKARGDALKAGAANTNNRELKDTDKWLVEITSSFEKGNSDVEQKSKETLQAKYLALELKAIKASRLGQASHQIESAVKNDAAKYAPATLKAARDAYKHAEMVIETDRHDTAAIDKASADATGAAEKLMRVSTAAHGKKGSEGLALEVDAKNQALAKAGEKLEASQTELDASQEAAKERLKAKDQQLEAKDQQLDSQEMATAAVTEQNSELKKKDDFNKSFKTAQESFTPDQAEVSRQGDNLVIRLKSLGFDSGRADLSGASFEVLNKVKAILLTMNAQKVTVEGHTDSVGAKDLNQKLSEERAQAVAKYFVSNEAVSDSQVKSVGYGDQKPLASNKTKAGRAQNRRVDVIVTPAGAAQE